QRPFLRKLPDGARLAFFRMHIAIGARDVQVAAENRPASLLFLSGGVGIELLEELHLGREVLATVGYVNRRNREIAEVDRDDPILEIKGRMRERGTLGREGLVDVNGDAGIALAAVPITPVALHFAERRWQLIGCGLDFL